MPPIAAMQPHRPLQQSAALQKSLIHRSTLPELAMPFVVLAVVMLR
jgi:hypothetical protein